MEEAVSHIEPDDSVAIGLALEHAIPFAVGHELIRQGTDELTVVGPISDVLFDQLVDAERLSLTDTRSSSRVAGEGETGEDDAGGSR